MTQELRPLRPLFEGDLMTAEAFVQSVRDGFFIDYDGSGCWSTADGRGDDLTIYPSQLPNLRKPDWATHVMWYNR